MSYKLKIISADYNQLAIGFYGSDDLPKACRAAVDAKDADFFIERAARAGSLTGNGTFRTKRDAVRTINNLERYNFYGLGWLKAKGAMGFGFLVSLEVI